MTHSALTNQIRLAKNQFGSREGARITTLLVHHQASTNDDSTIAMMVNGTRQVSANYTLSNSGRLTCVVDENNRAWTSGSRTDGGKGAAWDRRSITIEVANLTGAPGWTIAPVQYEVLAQLLVDLHRRYNVPLDRNTGVIGHRELWTRHRASYPTACPGGIDLDRIVRRAQELVGGAAPAPSPAAPKPSTGGVKAPAFPLPAGYYFGPKSGPKQSVSGYYSHREDFRKFQNQMLKRGWTAPRYGADGLYGDEWAGNIGAFQRDKGLDVDFKVGPVTWRAAWESPVT